MSNTKVPEGNNTAMPYIIVKDAAGFMSFMQQVFGAVATQKHMTDDNRIMHAEVRIGDSVIMLAESNDQWGAMTSGMFIYVPDADTTYQEALDAGATSIMPPADQSYGRSCGVTDAYGNTW